MWYRSIAALIVCAFVLAACGAPLPSTPGAVVAATPAASTPTAAPTLRDHVQPDPMASPSALHTVAWHGLRFSYDPTRYTFAETTPIDPVARSAALLTEAPNPCLQEPDVPDCSPYEVRFVVYPRNGEEVWSWLAQADLHGSFWPGNDATFTTILIDRPAVAWMGDGLSASETTYVVPTEDAFLMIAGDRGGDFVRGLHWEQPRAAPLAVGELVMTTPGRAWELWTEAQGGERVAERPSLYGGAFVTIVALEPTAVRVHTDDDVVGWIHALPTQALSAKVDRSGPQFQFLTSNYLPAQVVHANGIPLRDRPHSTATAIGTPITPDEELHVYGVRGDWLRVFTTSGDIRTGWARWNYDGTHYIEPREP